MSDAVVQLSLQSATTNGASTSSGYTSKLNTTTVRGPLTHDPGAPPIASQRNFIVQPLVTKE